MNTTIWGLAFVAVAVLGFIALVLFERHASRRAELMERRRRQALRIVEHDRRVMLARQEALWDERAALAQQQRAPQRPPYREVVRTRTLTPAPVVRHRKEDRDRDEEERQRREESATVETGYMPSVGVVAAGPVCAPADSPSTPDAPCGSD